MRQIRCRGAAPRRSGTGPNAAPDLTGCGRQQRPGARRGSRCRARVVPAAGSRGPPAAHRPRVRPPRPAGCTAASRSGAPGAAGVGAAAGDAGRRPQAGRDPAAPAGPGRHLRRGVPDHPVQPEGHRRLGGAGRGGRDGARRSWSPRCSPGPSTCPWSRAGDDVRRPRLAAWSAPSLARPRLLQSIGADPGHRDDRPRHRGRGRRPPAEPRRGVARDPREALAPDRHVPPAGAGAVGSACGLRRRLGRRGARGGRRVPVVSGAWSPCRSSSALFLWFWIRVCYLPCRP